MASLVTSSTLFTLCFILFSNSCTITCGVFYEESVTEDMAIKQGKYNGSSISILGRNPIFDDVREMPVVGGSGLFRLARGHALLHTVWFNKQGDAIIEYNVYVSHY
ncbi:hypothetical protein D5086_007584 [Populus alba]|uniref:Uncharacterized protein n=1 Tax=Populus alba TaxID=43335 RepID=A0ACC4CP83_POPAL